jgi:hypothetical protein
LIYVKYMAGPKHLLVSLLIFISLTASRPIHLNSLDCNGCEFRTELSKAPNQDIYKLTITATGGRQPYHYLLLNSENHLVSKDFSKRIFDGLLEGRYRCIVTDSQDCNKEQFIEVK